MSRLALYLLGPPRVERGGEPVKIAGRKTLALLAYLAVEGHTHRRDSLAVLLWPESDQSHARAELRRALSSLRRSLGEKRLEADRESVVLNPEAQLWLDVDAFRQRLRGCETHGHGVEEVCADCVPLLERAAELYRDNFMAGFTLRDSLAFDEWQFFQAEGLRQELAGALVRLANHYASQGDIEPAIAQTRRWLALDPTHEPAHRQLMALYAQAGQQSAALRQYRVCEQTLAAELRLTPSPETTALYERIRAGEDIGREPEPEPLIPYNLPAQPTRFIGRETELAELDGLIVDPQTRLVTIVGPGGIGKTRLALACAERQQRAKRQLNAPAPSDDGQLRFPDGVVFVSLAALIFPEHILPTLADALGFQAQAGGGETRTPRQQVLAFLRRKRLLLVLDNLEHLLEPSSVEQMAAGQGEDGAADLVAEIVRAAPAVQILATSRERLNLPEEQVYPIQGLEVPDWVAPEDAATYTAAQLFLQSARRVQPHFALEPDDVTTLTRICQLVGGMPLALELAASWVDTLSLIDIAAEIAGDLDFLATEWRGVPERHRSVRAAIATSWRQLSPEEQVAFAQLSVFRGGFKRDAARGVALSETGGPVSWRTLARLVNKSLLTYDQARDRYQVHQLLRQYGAEKLTDPDAARDRHSAHYCAALAQWDVDMQGPRQAVAQEEIERDLENVRAAWEWAAARQDVARLDQALDGLVMFFSLRTKLHDNLAACQLSVDAAGQVDETACDYADAQRVLARATIHQAYPHYMLGQGTLARSLLERAASVLDGPALVGHDTRAERALLLVRRGLLGGLDREQARQALDQSLSLFRAVGDRCQEAWCLCDIAWLQSDVNAAISIYEEVLALFQARGDYVGIGWSHGMLAALSSYLGDYDRAIRHHRDSLAPYRAGRIVQESLALCGMADNHRIRGDYDAAQQLYHEGLAFARSRGLVMHEYVALFGLGALAMDAYDVKQAGRRFQAVHAFAQEHQYHWGVALALAALGDLSSFQGQFDAGADYVRQSVSAVRASGQSDRAAMALCNLGRAQMLSGAFDQAQASIREVSAIAGDRTTHHIRALHSLHQCQLHLCTAQYELAIAGAQEGLRQAGEMQGENPWPGRDWFNLAVYTPRRGRRTGLIAQGHGVLGWAALAEREYAAAVLPLKESIAALREIRDREYTAWSLAALGRGAYGLGKREEAQAHLFEALEIVVEIRAFIPLLHLMPVIPVLLADEDDPRLKERAVELYALAESDPFVAKAQLFEDVAGRYVRAATASLPPEVVAAAQERGRELDWWETAEALLEELKSHGWSH